MAESCYVDAAQAPRTRTRQVMVGNVPVGGGAPVSVQSMCTLRFARMTTENGAIASYVHHDGKHADIVEFSFNKPETAENDEFKTFAHDVAMQIIASDPISARREDIPQETIDHETEIYRAQAAESGRPEKFWDGIINGRLKKFFQERALTEQVFVKDSNKSVAELCDELSKKLDDEIKVVRFIRYNFGE